MTRSPLPRAPGCSLVIPLRFAGYHLWVSMARRAACCRETAGSPQAPTQTTLVTMRSAYRAALGVTTYVVAVACGGTATTGKGSSSGGGGQVGAGGLSASGGGGGMAATTAGAGGSSASGGASSAGGAGGRPSSGSGGGGGTAGTGTAGSSGKGGAATGGSGGTGNGGSGGAGGNGTGGRIICPPCAAPPYPGCIGSGPCGCGPYTCPDAGNGTLCSGQLRRMEGSPACVGAQSVLWEAMSGNLGQFAPPACRDLGTNLPRYCCTEAFKPVCPG